MYFIGIKNFPFFLFLPPLCTTLATLYELHLPPMNYIYHFFQLHLPPYELHLPLTNIIIRVFYPRNKLIIHSLAELVEVMTCRRFLEL